MKLAPINKNEAVRYLVYGKNLPDENISNMIDKCELVLRNDLNPSYVYKIFGKEITAGGNIKLSGSHVIFYGSDINKHLDKCDKILLLCATLSQQADKIIRLAQISNITEALIYDALSSAAVEQVCDTACEEVYSKFPGYFQTKRFSPGYGDFPLDVQKEFLEITDATRKTGMTVNDGNILIPMKSVTAVIGLSDQKLLQKNTGCCCCPLNKSCSYRKEGTNCGF